MWNCLVHLLCWQKFVLGAENQASVGVKKEQCIEIKAQ